MLEACRSQSETNSSNRQTSSTKTKSLKKMDSQQTPKHTSSMHLKNQKGRRIYLLHRTIHKHKHNTGRRFAVGVLLSESVSGRCTGFHHMAIILANTHRHTQYFGRESWLTKCIVSHLLFQKELKRMGSIAKTPIFSHFEEVINRLTSSGAGYRSSYSSAACKTLFRA